MVSLLPGSKLGRYQVLEQVGRGGMAIVFKAHDPELNRHVAIKVLPSYHTEDPTFVERFRQEAQVVARLNHPSIVEVHDFGEDKGFVYIVMEYVPGGTLQRLLGRRLPLTYVLGLIGPVADALEAAHGQGVIHRDVKPANVLLDADGKPILSDFGMALVLERTGRLTRTGSLFGTPEYMAPEQALGRVVDPRSDLYSLGIVIYEMLLGHPPFRGDNPTTTLLAHVQKPVPPPSDVDPDIDPRLEADLIKALSKDPDDRYQTPTQLMQALTSASVQSETGSETQATIERPVVVGSEIEDRTDDDKEERSGSGDNVDREPRPESRRWAGRWWFISGAGAAVIGVAIIAPLLLIPRGGDGLDQTQEPPAAAGLGQKEAPTSAVSAGSTALETRADFNIDMFEWGFWQPGTFTSGTHTIQVTNSGQQPHELRLIRLAPGASVDDYLAALDSDVEGALPGTPMGRIPPIDSGKQSILTAGFTSGNYALVCSMPDMVSGVPQQHLVDNNPKGVQV